MQPLRLKRPRANTSDSLEGGILLPKVCVWACVSQSRDTHHGNGVRGEQLLGTHGRDVGDVGKDVHEGHKGNGDEDGPRKVPGDDASSDVKERRRSVEETKEAQRGFWRETLYLTGGAFMDIGVIKKKWDCYKKKSEEMKK